MKHVLLCLGFLLVATSVQAQTVIQVPLNSGYFVWDIPAPDVNHGAALKHTIVCGSISIDVPMPANSFKVKDVVPGPGTYSCTLYASNAMGRQVEPDVPFPTFDTGLLPMVPTNQRLEVR